MLLLRFRLSVSTFFLQPPTDSYRAISVCSLTYIYIMPNSLSEETLEVNGNMLSGSVPCDGISNGTTVLIVDCTLNCTCCSSCT